MQAVEQPVHRLGLDDIVLEVGFGIGLGVEAKQPELYLH
jgi:hypothetical protein